ncbi:MAG TPA: nucleoside kinase [Syntrophomonadaceae bacterium]|nr:nucleoside kinase [Syntrophomonadaceae bacterium]
MAISESMPTDEAIEIRVKDVGVFTIQPGITAAEFVTGLKDRVPYQVTAVIIDNGLKDLHHVMDHSCSLELVDVSSEIGARIYRRTALFMMLKACHDLFPKRKLMVKHSLSNGLYCEFLDGEAKAEQVSAIERLMKAMATSDLPINKMVVSKEEAHHIFHRQGQLERVKLFEYRDKEHVHIHEMDGYYEYFYDPMVDHTGACAQFKLLEYPPGLILQTPEIETPGEILPWIELPKLFTIYAEAKDWAEMMDIRTVAALNDIIKNGDIGDLIRINEALHEKKIAWIADQICSNPRIRVVLIAGPSSSGKTTFAQRLLIQLRVNGRKPVSISLDNYFKDREATPRDENGNYAFEDLEALKLDLFNNHLNKLIAGEETEIPVYNFKTGTTEPFGVFTKVPRGEPIIIEGIHGLNEQLTWKVPKVQKYKIFVSALTQVNIDYSNRIPTTEARLVRRIIRDERTRGYGAQATIKQWPVVRKGEEENIFPFQENADVMFNSSLVYELAVLKTMAEPLLEVIGPEYPEHVQASRNYKFFSYLRSVSPDLVPQNSILREFIGGSCFKV